MKRLTFVLLAALAGAVSAKPNVLFIAVDDLRPQMTCYGVKGAVTPALDSLASSGFRFDRAYCNIPVCGASRASLMTGIRPSWQRFTSYLTRADQDAPGITTLNAHFKNNGYTTISLGKIYHHRNDDRGGWSEDPWLPQQSFPGYARKESASTAPKGKRGPAVEMADQPDEAYADGKIASRAVEQLEQLAQGGAPWFLAVGFLKPHLPFVAPKRDWDLYGPDVVKMPANYYPPKNAPQVSLHDSGELRSYSGVPDKGLVPEDAALKLIHGYHACVSHTDRQIGRVLARLEALGLADNTIVILWGDHGWNLGEHTMWCKHCCYETSMRVPLIVRAPGLKQASGLASKALVEFTDIYPTLCDLAGLSRPEHLQGQSLVPVMRDPQAAVRDAAIGRYGNGDTIRTERWRYSEYRDRKTREVIARMLYDHQNDPDENINIIDDAALRPVVADLAAKLDAGKGR